MDTRPLYRREGFRSNPDFIRYTFHKLINEKGYTDFNKIVNEVKRKCQMIKINYYYGEIMNELQHKKNKDETISAPGVLEITDDASLSTDLKALNIDDDAPSSSKQNNQQQNKQLLKRLNKLTLDLETGINDTYDIIKKVLKNNCEKLDDANNIFDELQDIIEGIIFLLIEDKIDEVYKELKKE